MPELLHTGALGATAVSACCVAASGRRVRAPERAMALVMLVAMADGVLGWGLLAPVGWAVALLAAALASVAAARMDRATSTDRSARAMDALGAVLMSALLVLMAGSGATVGDHAGHGVSSSVLVWAVVAASALFAAASVHMGVRMRMPGPVTPVRVRIVRRAAPLAMGASVLLMAVVAIA